MKKSMRRFALNRICHGLSVAGVGLCSSLNPVSASDDVSGFMLEEIIVTAQRRTESLQDVPLSVTVVDSDFIEESRVRQLTDIVDYTPGLTGAPAGLIEPKFAIRGISSSQDIGLGAAESVGVFVDGSHMGKELSTIVFLDAAQVEVLKGPQGSLFGRNTSAGAINITTNQPTNDWSLDIYQSVGRYDGDSMGFDTTVIANVPIIEDKFLMRAALLRENEDGFSENDYLDREIGGLDSWSGRLTAKYIVSDDLEIDVELTSADRRGRGTAYSVDANNELVKLGNLAALAPQVGSDFGSELGLGPLDPTVDNAFVVGAETNTTSYDNKVSHNVPSRESLRAELAGIEVTWDVNDHNTLSFNTSYGETKASSLNDVDGTPINMLTLDIEGGAREFSQSVRLNGSAEGWDWVAGAIYYKTVSHQNNAARYDDAVLLVRDGLGGLPLTDALFVGSGTACDLTTQFLFSAPECGVGEERTLGKAKTEAWAVYGDVSHDITDRLTLSAGLRYSEEKKSIELSSVEANNFYNVYGRSLLELSDPSAVWEQAYEAATNGTIKDKDSFSHWTPRFTAKYQLAEDVMLFASLASGFKAGGFDPTPVDGGSGKFDEEKNKSYEIGIKSQWLNNRLQFNGALFYSDYEGLQVEVNEEGRTFTKNVPDLVSQGVELDILARVTQRLDLYATYSYNDTEFGRFQFENDGQQFDWTDNELPRAPQQTASLVAQYTLPLTDYIDLSFRGEGIYSGDYYYTLENSRDEHQSGYSRFNMRVSLSESSGRWSASLFAKNIGNKEHTVSRIDPLGVGAVSVRSNPRYWGVDLRYSL